MGGWHDFAKAGLRGRAASFLRNWNELIRFFCVYLHFEWTQQVIDCLQIKSVLLE